MIQIHMDTTHVTAGFASNLLPIKSGGGTFLETAGAPLTAEWEASQIVVPNSAADASGSEVDPTEFFLHMVGSGVGFATSRGIIAGYGFSRSVPQSPDPAIVGANTTGPNNWMRNMFDVGNDDSEVLENAATRNDELPYPHIEYPGNGVMAPVLQLHAHTDVTSTTTAVDNSFFMPGTQVPCGLLKFTNDTDSVLEIFVDLVPGHHRGYLCEPMQEF